MTPTDTIKYELDKKSRLLIFDRPQKYFSMTPMLYRLIPQTYCHNYTAEFCIEKTRRNDTIGDYDPLDICVLTERPIPSANILMPVVVIGGFRMIDNNEADDKIIAFLKGDMVYGEWQDITDIPVKLIEQLKHYFLTYKDIPGIEIQISEITHVYNKDEAYEVINRNRKDYDETFKGLKALSSDLNKRIKE